MPATKYQKFRLLMWKNYLLQWRNPVQSVLEIVVPVFFSFLLLFLRSLVKPEIFHHPTIFSAQDFSNFSGILSGFDLNLFPNVTKEIVYSPSSPQMKHLFAKVNELVQPHLTIESVKNSEILMSRLLQMNSFVGVEFPDWYLNVTQLPDELSYALRFPGESRKPPTIAPDWFNWKTDFLFPFFPTSGPRSKNYNDDGLPAGYYNEGFVFIQQFIFEAFMSLKNNLTIDLKSIPRIEIRKFPYPPYVQDDLVSQLEKLTCVMILLGFVYPCSNIIKNITMEKEKQLKETLKIMGLDSWLHWTAWFVKYLIYMFVTITLMTILLSVQWFGDKNPSSVFTYSSATCLWFFLMIYSVSSITFCFMISVLFSKASTASAVAALMWFITYSPYILLEQRYETISTAVKILLSFFSNTAMGLGTSIIIRYEAMQEGIQWNNIFQPVNVDDELHLGNILFMLVVDAILYLSIALYVEKIFPGDYGMAEKWNYPFKKDFWMGNQKKVPLEPNEETEIYNENFEGEPRNKIAGVKIKNLKKVYDDGKVAVKGLNLQLYEDQVTVLLGHNGAGKTTTMSMLIGMIPPTSGTVIIDGKEINEVRGSVGFCPQHNILFDNLTVREHIEFFSQLKGLHKSELEFEVKKFVKLLKLEEKIDSRSKSLSGGMKRKLSVGIALCAQSKVVLFDEPSSGVDPSSRRALWDVIQQEKTGRTILLSTHFMDEADVLGDRIAIMSSGKLKAVGSSFFLKKQFGSGYRLVCVKKPSCDVTKVTNLLRNYLPNINVATEIGTEFAYLLDETNVAVFQDMLSDLEANSDSLKLDSYGISMTTLEEVFHKVGSDNVVVKASEVESSETVRKSDVEKYYSYSQNLKLLSGFRLYLNQLLALVEKKRLHSLRNWPLLLSQVIIPMMFITLTILTVSVFVSSNDLPNLDLTIETYGQTVTTVEFNNSLHSNNSIESKLYKNYQREFNSFDSKRFKFQVIENSMQQHYMSLSNQFLSRVNKMYLFGTTITDAKTTVWFNNQGFHTLPISLSLLHNAILRTISGRNVNINVSNKPLPFKAKSRLFFLTSQNQLGFHLSFNISFSLAFAAAFFVVLYVEERRTKAKLLQLSSGINRFLYWFAGFLWDFFQFTVVALCMTLTIGVFQENGYSTFHELARIFFVFLVFGFAVLPIIYISTLVFKDSASGFMKLSIFFLFFGAAIFMVVFMMDLEVLNLINAASTLTKYLLIFPHFNVAQAIKNIHVINGIAQACQIICKLDGACEEKLCKIKPECCGYFEWKSPGILRNIVYLIVLGFTAFVLLFLIEFGALRIVKNFFNIVCQSISKVLFKNGKQILLEDKKELDFDVQVEKDKIDAMNLDDLKNYNLVKKNLTRYYKSFRAVNNLCIGVKSSECFGLLGVNGAGKTSTFKMLTGDLNISEGEAWVQNISLKTDMKKVHKQIGYCPQFDALIDELTGRETLRFFALARGIPKIWLQEVIAKISTDFNLTNHLDKQVKKYSGGNKRKLSTAVALLGNPVIIYLDEPTTGMDPGARRNLWNVVSSVRDSGKSIILTSHSMEECEALCTRLVEFTVKPTKNKIKIAFSQAIMVNGEFKCLGSTQHLKSKFGEGFVLTLKLKKTPIEKRRVSLLENQKMNEKKILVEEFIVKQFCNAVLKEEYYDMMTFVIPQKDIKWSQIFGVLEKGKEEFNIEDYSIGQSSLEQIFLLFTKYQKTGDEK